MLLAHSEILSQGFLPGKTLPRLRGGNSGGMEQDGRSTSCLTLFRILRIVFTERSLRSSSGGSDGRRRSVQYRIGQNTRQRTCSLNAQFLRLDWTFPKLYKHFISNLRVDSFWEHCWVMVSTVIDVSFLDLWIITDRISFKK